jgi:pimeloyl-ACP methyl ester carboxylesterase
MVVRPVSPWSPVDSVPGSRIGAIRVNGLDVCYADSVHDQGAAASVVLVHGTGGSTARHFPFLYPMLASRQRVVSIDLATPAVPAKDGLASLAAQVEAVVGEVLPGDAVTLVGYSLGAVVAATLAAARPDQFSALVLLAGWLRTDVQQLLRNDVWRALRADRGALGRYQAFCAHSAPYLAQRTAEEIQALVDSCPADDATAAQMDINRMVDLTDIAPRISCPTLIVAGTDDQMTPRRQAKALFGAIPEARYTEVTSGHALVRERPAELVHLITAFNADPKQYPPGTILPARRP